MKLVSFGLILLNDPLFFFNVYTPGFMFTIIT